MKVKELNAALVPFKMVCNRNAMSLVYKTLRVSPDCVEGASNYARVRISLATGIKEPFCIDAWTFISVVGSLSGEAEIEFTLAPTTLSWKAGGASGKLARIPDTDIPVVQPPAPPAGKRPTLAQTYTPSPTFAAALTLGSLSCGPVSTATIGAYGVHIECSTGRIMASDNTTASCATVQDGLPFAKSIYLSPDAAELLAYAVKTTGSLQATDSAVYYSDDWISLQVSQVPPLEKDFGALFDAYGDADSTVKIAPDAVGSFIKRASALSEKKGETLILMHASNGQLGLSFEQGVSNTDEVYVAQNLLIPEIAEIKLSASAMARVLQNADTIALDHIQRQVIVFMGEACNFRYIISGRAAA
jgi:hypothetical protein